MTALVWLTRDLRVHDHPALRADLDERLGGTLVIRRGLPERELTALAREAEAGEVHFSDDSGSFARRRIDRTVFSPFHRAWLGAPRRDVLGRPRSFGPLPSGLHKGRLPSLASLGLEQEVEDPLPGGESAARERLSRFLGDGVREYSDNHDALGRDKTSRLSPYLHFGCLSPREVESRRPRGRGADAFRRQLCWRDFYHHVLLHFPGNAHDEFQERYGRELSWSDDEDAFRAWCDGRRPRAGSRC